MSAHLEFPLFITVTLNGIHVCVILLVKKYRRPDRNERYFLDIYSKLIIQLKHENKRFLIWADQDLEMLIFQPHPDTGELLYIHFGK